MSCVSSLKRLIVRVIFDEYLDLYVLAVIAVAVSVLGVLGIANVATLVSVALALLAVLAYSQIRSRRQVAEIANSRQHDPLSIFRSDFPEDLIHRRATASSVLLIGISMTRTVQGGSLADLRRTLLSGGRIRVLTLDPTNEELVRAASSQQRHHGMTPARLKRRIQGALDEVADLRDNTRGDLEIRVVSFIPHVSINVLDADTANGLIVVQQYEYKPPGEAAPIFCLKPADGVWYGHFFAEAQRIWEDGNPWPLSPAQTLTRSQRPSFQETFGSELEDAMSQAREIMITGVTRNALIMSNYNKFEEWLQNGGRIRIILVNPSSPAIVSAADRYYAEISPDTVRERVRQTLQLLTELKRSTGGTISVRLTSHPLAMGLVAVDSSTDTRSDASALFIEYYTYQARGEPKFILQPSDHWFEHFLQEAEALWKSATDHELVNTAAKTSAREHPRARKDPA
jgi:hypothetical protein